MSDNDVFAGFMALVAAIGLLVALYSATASLKRGSIALERIAIVMEKRQ